MTLCDVKRCREMTDDAEGATTLVDAMEDHMPSYDESLYYACKKYVQNHSLYYKQQKRKVEVAEVPLRYSLLMLWTRPLATNLGQCYFVFQLLLVALSIVQLLLESTPAQSVEVRPWKKGLWDAIEYPTAFFFSLDLVVHIALLPPVPNDFSRHSRMTFVKKADFWVDVLSILPTILALFAELLPFLPQVDFLKALRVLRFTKVLRQFHAVDQLAFTLERSSKPLLGPFVFLFGVLVTMSGAVFYVERGRYDPDRQVFLVRDDDCLGSAARILNPEYPCPEKVSKFISLPHTIWFCLVTLTTVGYGDMVPNTHPGRFFATLCILCGNVLTAMPIAIVGTYFTEIVTSNRKRQEGDPSAAFGRSGADAQPSALQGLRKQEQSALTLGERLLEVLATLDCNCNLMQPQGAVVHKINDFVKQEYETLVSQLSKASGIDAARAHRSRASTPLALDFASPPSQAHFPGLSALTKPLNFPYGAQNGALTYTVDGESFPQLPLMLFSAQVSPVPPHSVSITPLFPVCVKVNGQRLPYDSAARLLVGDHIAIHADDTAPPLLSYQFLKTEVAAPAHTVVRSQQVADRKAIPSSHSVTLKPTAPDAEYRGLTFAAFERTDHEHIANDYSDL